MKFRTVLSALVLCIQLQFVWTEEWPQHAVLDGKGRYHLYWRPPADESGNGEIVFKVEVRAKGYVGFGLSFNGGMAGSDIVTGWVKDGQPYFQDRHATGNTLPEEDQKEDWILMEARENETHTTLKFRRKLNTCDKEDRVIDDNTVRAIFAFSDHDPTENQPSYHSGNRGAKSLRLLQYKAKSHAVSEDPSLLHWDVRSPKIDVSQHETLYWCKIFKSPSTSKKFHIVRGSPLIQEGNEPFVHHAALYECKGGTAEEFEDYVDRGSECFVPGMADVMTKCQTTTVTWAVGGEDATYPENVGMPMEQDAYYMLQVHYNNPERVQGIIDESGLRLYYTPDLKEQETGVLIVHAKESSRMLIPPGQEKFVVAVHSNPECFDALLPSDGIKVFGIFLHAHLTGRRITARHFRGNRELPPIADDKNFDFNYQDYMYPKKEITILPGDQITVECTYDTSERTEVTFGGYSTQEEMCISSLLYYPKVRSLAAFSAPTFSTLNSLLHTNFTDVKSLYSLSQYNWSNVEMAEVQNVLRYSEQEGECNDSSGQKIEIKNLVSYPDRLEPFIEEVTVCSEDTREQLQEDIRKPDKEEDIREPVKEDMREMVKEVMQEMVKENIRGSIKEDVREPEVGDKRESPSSSKAVTIEAYCPLLSLALASAQLLIDRLSLLGI